MADDAPAGQAGDGEPAVAVDSGTIARLQFTDSPAVQPYEPARSAADPMLAAAAAASAAAAAASAAAAAASVVAQAAADPAAYHPTRRELRSQTLPSAHPVD
jgi:hypothetical protein